MHPLEPKAAFMLMRANGWSLGKTSEKLKIRRSTLFEWGGELQKEIHFVKCFRVEKLQEKYLPSFEEELQLGGSSNGKLRDPNRTNPDRIGGRTKSDASNSIPCNGANRALVRFAPLERGHSCLPSSEMTDLSTSGKAIRNGTKWYENKFSSKSIYCDSATCDEQNGTIVPFSSERGTLSTSLSCTRRSYYPVGKRYHCAVSAGGDLTFGENFSRVGRWQIRLGICSGSPRGGNRMAAALGSSWTAARHGSSCRSLIFSRTWTGAGLGSLELSVRARRVIGSRFCRVRLKGRHSARRSVCWFETKMRGLKPIPKWPRNSGPPMRTILISRSLESGAGKEAEEPARAKQSAELPPAPLQKRCCESITASKCWLM